MTSIYQMLSELSVNREEKIRLQQRQQQLEQLLPPNDPERQEVAAKLLGLRAETAAGWNAAVDWTARYAGTLRHTLAIPVLMSKSLAWWRSRPACARAIRVTK